MVNEPSSSSRISRRSESLELWLRQRTDLRVLGRKSGTCPLIRATICCIEMPCVSCFNTHTNVQKKVQTAAALGVVEHPGRNRNSSPPRMAHPQGTASAPTENSGTHASLQCTRSGAFPGQEPTSSGGAVEAINQEAEQKHTSLRLNPSTDKGNTVLTQGIVGVITAEPTVPLPVTSDSVANAATVAATIVQQDGAHEQVQAGTPEQSQGASTNATLTDNEEEATHTTPTHTASILQHHPSRPENGVPLAIIGSVRCVL